MITFVLTIVGLLLAIGLLRFIYLASKSGADALTSTKKRSTPCRTLVVVGSGGHTAEMLRLLGGMNLDNYAPRVYVVAESDKISLEKVQTFESQLAASNASRSTSSPRLKSTVFDVRLVPRARQVMQSYITSIFSTLVAIAYSLPIVIRASPDLVLCNGPGTCIPVCFWSFLVKFLSFGLKDMEVVYVESMCRVEKLSLSGLLLYYLYMSDNIFVQWPQLKKKYPRTRYIGRVV